MSFLVSIIQLGFKFEVSILERVKRKSMVLIFLRSKEKDSLNFVLRVIPHGRVFLIKTGVESRSLSES